MTDYSTARTKMVDCQIRPSDVTRFPIIEAMLNVPREEYVPTEMRPVAYAGEHVPIGGGRAVLDPRILAKMLDAVDIQPDELVLDIGCGLGYSTAVAAWFAEAVIAVEEDDTLALDAENILSAQSVDNAFVHNGVLAKGAPKHGPYDVILIEGAVEEVPQALTDQLKEGGRIAAIFADGALGRCLLGIRSRNGIAWRPAFDANAPVLPGFSKSKEFVF